MKTLICPDKFKGSLTALKVAKAIEKGLPNLHKSTLVPMADGGEGSLDVIAANIAGRWKTIEVNDPLFRPVLASYYISEKAAFVEMARASGYELLTNPERNCMIASTFGTGELIRDAIQEGIKSIYLFIGGSATNDGGIGVAAALGYAFLDKTGVELSPIGENLIRIHDIISPENSLPEIEFTVVCDVTNPFFGPNGAAHVYAAQKGASPEQIVELDKGLANLAHIIQKQFKINLQEIKGAGAAGGLGGGAVAFLNAKIQSGTETLMDVTGLHEKIKNSDLVITGEGKVDTQSISGKLIDGICKIAKANQIPVWIICGISEIPESELKELGVEKVIALVNEETPAEYAIQHAGALIEKRIQELFQS
ncbi:MAG: glycerate kinase [Spirosomaceae bacterium]|nr:glycerate kinase [Spirosomataceae bacterium]